MATTVAKVTNTFEMVIINATEEVTNLEDANSGIKLENYSLFVVDLYVNYLASGCFAAFGTVANIINMIIFYRLGLKDSMSVGLMALSATDFLTSLSGSVGIFYIIIKKYYPESVVNPLVVHHVSIGWLRDILFLCSAWITTILSVERCVCVVFPFKVKEIFTRSRCIIAVVVIYVVHMAIHLPIFLSHKLVWSKVDVEIAPNTTVLKDRLVVKLADNRAQIQFYVDILNGSVLPVPAQVLVLISVVWMIHGLRVAARVRKAHTQSVGTDANSKPSILSSNEVKLVKVVWFLAIILTVCMVPRFLAVYAKQIFPSVSYGNKNAHIYSFLWTLVVWTTTINALANIFVYVIINRSYRDQFRAIFRLGKEPS